MDGVDEYQGRELLWAVETCLCGLPETDERERPSAVVLLDDCWDFIEQSCLDSGQPIPARTDVHAALVKRLNELMP